MDFGAAVEGFESIRIFPVRTPTLPPATHTNVYVVNRTAFDPASPYSDEQARLAAALDALENPIERIVLTHHHVDHVSGATVLADRLRIPIAAHQETAHKLAGRVKVDEILREGDVVAGLRALHTPGHAPGHLCFLDEKSRAIIAGDMVASIGTIVVEPDDGGDMIEYLASLERLRTLTPSVLLPAHGDPIRDADGLLAFYLKHRMEREARVFAALTATAQTLDQLVPVAYPDVPAAIYPLAERSLLAHLKKLEREGRAHNECDRWRI